MYDIKLFKIVNVKQVREMVDKQKVVMSNGKFDLEFQEGSLASLKLTNDEYDTQYISPGKHLGDVEIAYRFGRGEVWRKGGTSDPADFDGPEVEFGENEYKTQYHIRDKESNRHVLSIETAFSLKKTGLFWDIHLVNPGEEDMEIGDLALPFPMNSSFERGQDPSKSIMRHSFISGHASFIFWMRCNAKGPHLLLTPEGGSKFEYYDLLQGPYRAFINSKASGELAREKGCRWRLPNTSCVLHGKGKNNVSHSFKLQWASDYNDIRDRLVKEGLVDVQVIPGMTLPSDLSAKFYLRTRQSIDSLRPEFPEETELVFLGQKQEDLFLYEVKFNRLGENYIEIRYDTDRYMRLEFFSTEPLETLIRKRGDFLANSRHQNPDKWYDGLISDWNMETGVLLGPDNYDRIKGWRRYAVTCDDPGLCKPSFLAAKNALYPVQNQVDVLEYYIENFVWGGLQRTDEEEYSYGIYGIPDWHALRSSTDEGIGGKLHIWRIYDYPHIILLYYSMYEIAEKHPEITTNLNGDAYLERAYRTALALFNYPMELRNWSAYETGLYNELIIMDVLRELKAKGWHEKANRLENHWKKKALFFVKENTDLFGSEYAFDSTGFESTHALAKYAIDTSERIIEEDASHRRRGLPPIKYDEAVGFMERQIETNVFCRGWLETAYYLYGSDYRGCNALYTLSYMSQMGGWAVLDYAINYAHDPYPYLRLGYASFLSSWALMNSGEEESGYGYWYPGAENDGAAGGGFEPAPYGETWLEQKHSRGAWYYACEIDLGFSGALRSGASILADDPVFGLFCYGGEFDEMDGRFRIFPKDGIRRRFGVIFNEHRLFFTIDNHHFSTNRPVEVQKDLSEIIFPVESAASESFMQLSVSGLPDKPVRIIVNGQEVAGKNKCERKQCFNLKMQEGNNTVKIIL